LFCISKLDAWKKKNPNHPKNPDNISKAGGRLLLLPIEEQNELDALKKKFKEECV
jgi:hypothetical protein